MSITQIKLRRDTSTNWTTRNPTLALGEPGLEIDTLKVKYGDGTTPWNTLPYPNVGTGPQGPAGTNGLDGAPGPQGPAGTNGLDGAPGTNGLSAYEVAVAGGFVGTEADWLASLVGPAGADGAQGPAGANGSSTAVQTFTMYNSDNFNMDQAYNWTVSESYQVNTPIVHASYGGAIAFVDSGIYKITVQSAIYPQNNGQWPSSASAVGTSILTDTLTIPGIDQYVHHIPSGINSLTGASQTPSWVDQYIVLVYNAGDSCNIRMFTDVPNDFVPAYGVQYFMTVVVEKIEGNLPM